MTAELVRVEVETITLPCGHFSDKPVPRCLLCAVSENPIGEAMKRLGCLDASAILFVLESIGMDVRRR